MSCQQRKQKRQRSQKRQRRQRGGDAANWAAAVYGSAGSQTSIPNSGNLIAANNLSGVNMCTDGGANNTVPIVGGAQVVTSTSAPVVTTLPVIKGGKKRNQGGKGLITDIAVPAVLLYANQVVRSRRTMSKKSKSRKNFSRRYRRRR